MRSKVWVWRGGVCIWARASNGVQVRVHAGNALGIAAVRWADRVLSRLGSEEQESPSIAALRAPARKSSMRRCGFLARTLRRRFTMVSTRSAEKPFASTRKARKPS